MSQDRDTILVTGAAGFIGFHVAAKLLPSFNVVGIDNLNDYYDPSLKSARLFQLERNSGFTFHQLDVADKTQFDKLFGQYKFKYIVHLAAQAGVRYSISNPYAYLNSNLLGFLNVLEACRHQNVEHLVYASSSSVYGANRKMPFSTKDTVDHPISLYAATKKSNELMAHTYSSLYNIPTTGLRFFTVYGPWGRPDMAIFLFTKAIIEGKPIDVYNSGQMKRDFTYVDDIAEGVVRIMHKIPQSNSSWDAHNPDASSSFAPYRIYNIGNNSPVELGHFIEVLEEKIGKKAIRNFLPLQDGDVLETYAEVSDLANDVGFRPSTALETGIANFVHWYKSYYKI